MCDPLHSDLKWAELQANPALEWQGSQSHEAYWGYWQRDVDCQLMKTELCPVPPAERGCHSHADSDAKMMAHLHTY